MPDNPLTIRLGAALREALDQHCADTGREIADVVREAVARLVKQPKLGKSVKRGRPPKEPQAG